MALITIPAKKDCDTGLQHLIVLFLCLLPLGSALAAEDLDRSEHNARRDAFFNEVSNVALVPLRGAQIKGREDVAELTEMMLREKLERYDIRSVPASVYGERYDRKMQELGGMYDPISGQLIESKRDEITRYAREGVEANHAIDAYLIPTLTLASVPYYIDEAQWDGVKENIYLPKAKSIWTGGAAADGGNILALSLNLRLERPDGSDIFESQGGWQLAEKFAKEGRKSLLPADLFDDERRNRLAVHFALRPILMSWKDHRDDKLARRREKPRP